jgi:antitoxin VapB
VAILIEDPETEAAVRKLAAATGRTLAEAVKASVEKELATLPGPRMEIDRAKVDELLARIHALPRANEHLTDDEIVGYDENGLPT